MLSPTFVLHPAFQLIAAFYGEKCAKRSGVPLINHICEGLTILEFLGAEEDTKAAYCIHPILQSDEALSEYEQFDWNAISGNVLILAMEYRNIANQYLSTRTILSLSEINLSPLKAVNDMLIADKVQNRKDFELYHMNKHPRSKELECYFSNWLERLGVSEEKYKVWKQFLIKKD